MKNIVSIGFSIFLAFSAFAAQKIVDSKITGVTVYPVGAMVNRTATVSLSSGENFIMLSKRSGMNVQQNFGGTTSNVYSPAKSLVLEATSFTI